MLTMLEIVVFVAEGCLCAVDGGLTDWCKRMLVSAAYTAALVGLLALGSWVYRGYAQMH